MAFTEQDAEKARRSEELAPSMCVGAVELGYLRERIIVAFVFVGERR
jgi:hypothetical protein